MVFVAYDISGLPSEIDDSGYVKVFVGYDHPYNNNGYVFAHRLIVESSLRRYIDTEEQVHHINEIKSDNRLENLYLCSQEEHVLIHNRGRKYSLTQKSKIRKGVLRDRRVS